MLNMNDDRINSIVNSLYERRFFRRVSRFFFLADFDEKMKVAVWLIRHYFQTDKLDDIAYDIVKSYCLSENYSLDNVTILEDTDEVFCSFFEKYIQSFIQMARYVEYGSKGRVR